MHIKKILYSFITLILPLSAFAEKCGGKVDAGPVYVHLNVLESGHTVKKLDMCGFKVNGTVMLTEDYGFCVKPDILYASGHGELIAGALGFGHVTPINESFCITPSAGLSLTNLRTSVNLTLNPLLPKMHFRERFRSLAPYIGLEGTYTIVKGLRVCASIQYSWSRTHTKIEKLDNITQIKGSGKFKGNSKGPSYAMMIEQDLNDKWSLHLGAAYNTSMSHEKHGLRGYGLKIGLAHWF